jgi:hypothetical protein
MATVTFYKATRPDGTSFYNGTTKWQVGCIVRHPAPDLSLGLCSAGVLHISDAPGETLVGGWWPCRLFEVEPRDDMIGSEEHKYGCTAVKVVRELPAWQALGPNGEAVAALIKRCRTMTYDEAEQLSAAGNAAGDAATYAAGDAAGYAAGYAAWSAAGYAATYAAWDAAGDAARSAARSAAWSAARYAAWDAARSAAWDAAWDAAWAAAWSAARSAAWALMVKDLITPEQFDLLYGPWASVMGS